MIEKNDMICGTCNGLLEDDRGHECECEKNRVISQAIHKQKHFENLKNDLLPIAWHPNRVYDWCFDEEEKGFLEGCLLYTSPSPRDGLLSRMPSSA